MMKQLCDICYDDFKDKQGETFQIDDYNVSLIQVSKREAAGARFRDPVDLVFKSETDLGFSDGVFKFHHEKIGTYNLFVSRIVDPDDILYEIVLG